LKPSVLKNLTFSISSNLIRVYTGSVIFILLAKLLSLEAFGILTFGISLSAIISVCAEFGFSIMTMRDIPQKRFEFNIYIYNILVQKVIISLIVTVLGIFTICYLYENINFKIGLIFIVNGIILSFFSYFLAVFKSSNRFQLETYITIINAILLTILICVHYFLKFDIIILSLIYVAINLIKLLCAVIQFIQVSNFKLFDWDKEIQGYLFKNSWSFGLHYIIGIFYFSVDTQLIAIFLDNEQVALYQAVLRIIFLIMLVTDVISQVFLPYLSNKFSEQKTIQFNNIFQLLVESTILVIVPILYITSLFGESILSILYTDAYNASIPLILPLFLMVILRANAVLYGLILTISDLQVLRVKSVFISLIFSFTFNIFLIPRYGIIGAAWANVMTHLILLLLYLFYSKTVSNKILVNKSICTNIIIAISVLFVINYLPIANFWLLALFVFTMWILPIIYYINKEKHHFLISIIKSKVHINE